MWVLDHDTIYVKIIPPLREREREREREPEKKFISNTRYVLKITNHNFHDA